MNRNSFFRSRKFKYGSVATAFTVAFVAIVVIFNIIFSALAQKYMWYIDMTKEQVFTLSEEAKEIMSDITEDVYIHFASEPAPTPPTPAISTRRPSSLRRNSRTSTWTPSRF